MWVIQHANPEFVYTLGIATLVYFSFLVGLTTMPFIRA